MRRSLPARLAENEDGTGILELVIVMPFLLLLLLGTIDVSRMVAAGLDLEQAAQRTTDLALSARPTSSDSSYLVDEAVAAAQVGKEDVTAEIYLTCDGTKQADFDSACPTGQTSARYVDVAIRRQVQPMLDWMGLARALGFGYLPSAITVQGDSIVRFQ